MAAKAKISVLITTYNLERYVGEALSSVLEQESSYPFEVLVGDDGSSDGTLAVIEEYAKRYPGKLRLIVQQREAGKKYDPVRRASANRLSLLEEAEGEYCCFLDGDDYYTDRTRLQRMTEILEREENRDCVMCAHNLWMDWPDGSRSPLCRAKKEQKLTLKQYWPLMFLQANALLFRNIFREHRPEGVLTEFFDDNNITFRLFQQGSMYYLPECMGAYRQLEDSSWNTMSSLQHSALNMIGYNVELLIAPECRELSDIRHYPDLKELWENRESLTPERLQPFYDSAEKSGLQEALRAYHMGTADREELKKRLDRSGQGYRRARLRRGVRKLLGLY